MSQAPAAPSAQSSSSLPWVGALLLILVAFFFSIELLGESIELFGSDLAKQLFTMTSNPVIALFIGIGATTLFQSSSATTSIIVAMVGSGSLSMPLAVPMIMGANIGTTVTNTIVSLGQIGNPVEFRRAFAASTVHDMFNMIAVILFLPLELATGFLTKAGMGLAGMLQGVGGFKFLSPVKAIIKPMVKGFLHLVADNAWISLAVSVVVLYGAITLMTKVLKKIFMGRVEGAFSGTLFDRAWVAFIAGVILTFIVQSSSITTSMVVPLAGAGLLTLQQIFPYTLGANIGTTMTAILASLLLGELAPVGIAMVHLSFNVAASVLIWPFRRVPIFLAETLATYSVKSRIFPIVYLLLLFVALPLGIIFLFN